MIKPIACALIAAGTALLLAAAPPRVVGRLVLEEEAREIGTMFQCPLVRLVNCKDTALDPDCPLFIPLPWDITSLGNDRGTVNLQAYTWCDPDDQVNCGACRPLATSCN